MLQVLGIIAIIMIVVYGNKEKNNYVERRDYNNYRKKKRYNNKKRYITTKYNNYDRP